LDELLKAASAITSPWITKTPKDRYEEFAAGGKNRFEKPLTACLKKRVDFEPEHRRRIRAYAEDLVLMAWSCLLIPRSIEPYATRRSFA
jgi:hypothetical protein